MLNGIAVWGEIGAVTLAPKVVSFLVDTDMEGLFQCYSNLGAAKYFNDDCCDDNFYYTDFVRFRIVDIESEKLIGMAEICPSYKYLIDGNCMEILRLDLLLEYESRKAI